MATEGKSPYRVLTSYFHLGGLIAILAAIAWVGLRAGSKQHADGWLWILVLMIAFAVLVGHAITGYWRGILIDNRNKMSLSRLQIVAWTLLILSALFAAVLSNVELGSQSPLSIDIPSQLWVLMGISTGSAVASATVLGNKRGRYATGSELTRTVTALATQGNNDVDTTSNNVVIKNTKPEAARWADLLKGDEVGNASVVDVGKLQMFLFTFILLMSYGSAIAMLFQSDGMITALPELDDGMNVLLGISHIGYLSSKAVSYTEEEARPA